MSVDAIGGSSGSYDDYPVNNDPPPQPPASDPSSPSPTDGVDATPPGPLWTPPENRSSEPSREPTSDDKSKKEWEAQAAAQAEAYTDAQQDAKLDESAARAEKEAADKTAAEAGGSNGSNGSNGPAGPQKPGGAPGAGGAPGPGGAKPSGGTGASTGTGGEAPHPTSPAGGLILTQQEYDEFATMGLTMKPDGAGGYHITATNPEIVNLPAGPRPVEANAPHTPPGSSTPVNSGGPPSSPATPAAGGPAEVKETDPAATDDKLVTGLGPEIDELVNKSPALKEAYLNAIAKGWKIQVGDKNEAGNGIITINPKTAGGDPALLTTILAHELGHANYDMRPEVSARGNSRQDYINKNTERHLDNEGYANFQAMKARQEIRINGGDTPVPGNHPADTQRIWDDYRAGRINEEQAVHQMGELFKNEPYPGAGGKTYQQVYDEYYQGKWSAEQAQNM